MGVGVEGSESVLEVSHNVCEGGYGGGKGEGNGCSEVGEESFCRGVRSGGG